MTEYKVGDKVRVEIEGVVEYASALTATIHVQDSQGNFAAQVSPESGVKITKIVDVPTKPGAVVYPCTSDGSHVAYVRMEDGLWANPYGDWAQGSEVERFLMEGSHYVAFEGVEE